MKINKTFSFNKRTSFERKGKMCNGALDIPCG